MDFKIVSRVGTVQCMAGVRYELAAFHYSSGQVALLI